MPTGRILLHGMVLFGHHGHHDAERQLGQRFLIDVEVSADLSHAGETDRLEDTIDYSLIFDIVKQVVEGPPHNLLESLAASACRQILAALPVETVLVRIKKPGVALPGVLDYSAVELTMERSGT